MDHSDPVVFRTLIEGLRSTTYGSHGLYMYPAKFIPHVVRYAITEYTEPGDWVFDPFAGYGTVAIEASLTGRNAILWDLNPMTRIITYASTYSGEISLRDFELDWEYDKPFHPLWENITYWHPKEFYEVLARLWGYWHREIYAKAKTREDLQRAYLVAIPLFKVTRYFSYSDEKVAKLYKSKYAKEKVSRLLSMTPSTLVEKIKYRYALHTRRVINKIEEYRKLNPQEVEIEIKTSWRENDVFTLFDSLHSKLKRDVRLLITSPPYLQAQEYIRSFKLELAWLGYTGSDLRELASHEIPYRTTVPDTEVVSTLYKRYREVISRLGDRLLKVYDVYFKSLAHFFNKNARRCEVIAVFVGECKIRDIKIPVVNILREHLESLGFKHKETKRDIIITRRMFRFKNDINPATRVKTERIPAEFLLTVLNSRR